MAERDFRLTDRYLELKGALHLHLIRLLEDRGIDIESWSDAKAAELIMAARAHWFEDEEAAAE